MGTVQFKDSEGHEVFDIGDGGSSPIGAMTPTSPADEGEHVNAFSQPPHGVGHHEPARIRDSEAEEDGVDSPAMDALSRELARRNDYVPTVFRWEHGGKRVFVTGTFNNWSEHVEMKRSGNDFTYIHNLKKGKHAFKFVVDGEWRYSQDQPTVYDRDGHINNYIDLTEFSTRADAEKRALEEMKQGLGKVEDEDEYGQEVPHDDEYTKQPPPLPPHLRQIVLNTPPSPEDPRRLTTPLHVTVNHLHCTAIKDRIMVLGTSQRYRRKFVTTVYYSWLPS